MQFGENQIWEEQFSHCTLKWTHIQYSQLTKHVFVIWAFHAHGSLKTEGLLAKKNLLYFTNNVYIIFNFFTAYVFLFKIYNYQFEMKNLRSIHN